MIIMKLVHMTVSNNVQGKQPFISPEIHNSGLTNTPLITQRLPVFNMHTVINHIILTGRIM